jgi:exoribonuclease R
MNSLYACRYMQDKIGKVYNWKISGLSEFALFIEIEIWIEVTLYLPRGDHHINQIEWVLTSSKWKIIATIWDTLAVKIDSVNMSERRIVGIRI